MIEIEIPQDISKYESKLIGPFTTRQTICVVGLAVGCISSFFAVSSPFALIGWYKPYGMHFEKFAKSVFVSLILAPAKRLYKIDNVYDRFDKMIDAEEKAKLAKESQQNTKKSKSKKRKGAG